MNFIFHLSFHGLPVTPCLLHLPHLYFSLTQISHWSEAHPKPKMIPGDA